LACRQIVDGPNDTLKIAVFDAITVQLRHGRDKFRLRWVGCVADVIALKHAEYDWHLVSPVTWFELETLHGIEGLAVSLSPAKRELAG
jgi:hypothetical protein